MSNLTSVFTDIADAIRGKYGSTVTTRYKPIEMAQAITDIPSGDGWEEVFAVAGSGRIIYKIFKNSDNALRFVVVPDKVNSSGNYGGICYDEEYDVYTVCCRIKTNSLSTVYCDTDNMESNNVSTSTANNTKIRKSYIHIPSGGAEESKLIFASGSSSSAVRFYKCHYEDDSPNGVRLDLDYVSTGFSFIPRDVVGVQDPNYEDHMSFLVVGDGGNIISGSNMPNSWRQRTSGVTTALNAIVYSPSLDMFVAVGASGVILTSSDWGQTWTQRTSPVSTTLRDITWSNTYSKFFAVGDNSTILSSSDGITWTKITAVITGMTYVSVACYESIVLVGSTGSNFYWSTDGTRFDRNKCKLYYSLNFSCEAITPKI